MRQAAAGAAHDFRRRLVLGPCLSRAMVRGSFPRAHTSLQNAFKPHFVGTPSSRGLHRRASLSSRPLLPPRRPGRGGWGPWGPSLNRATTAAPGRGAKDRRSRSWGTTTYRVVQIVGFSDLWCVLSGRGRSRQLWPETLPRGWCSAARQMTRKCSQMSNVELDSIAKIDHAQEWVRGGGSPCGSCRSSVCVSFGGSTQMPKCRFGPGSPRLRQRIGVTLTSFAAPSRQATWWEPVRFLTWEATSTALLPGSFTPATKCMSCG